MFNADQPERIVDVFRDAVQTHLTRNGPTDQKTKNTIDKLKSQTSFHLLSPLLEAYFFGDPNAVQAMGISSDAPKLKADNDLEHFETDDAEYLEAVSELSGKGALSAEQWYPRHPKEYCKYLLDPRAPFDPKTKIYKETNQGVNALKTLDAQTVLAAETHQQFLRAFINDLATAVGQETIAGEEHPLTSGPGEVLRNI